ncbi:MAG: AAA family ATPase [Colwelliaceae bacterium]|nr:AAA family ATPase [Colwelliaceae bacterium]
MYTAYFGLSEAPFTIAPDPAYLFMSDRHREALAHLSYGLGGSSFESSGGFVLLTGEVGTGKTTISRTVMEKLPENTQASFILNPTLSCEELLACICDNLKIRYKKTGATLKYLTDKIQNKLLKNHNDNINTLLIIDEAQHLKPEVLEQLRLLTNLETNTKKLLQVILIGQPELQQLLQRRDLRQLAQRITARYHLLPLTKLELTQYIQHRLSVAQCTRQIFNKAAISALHKISKGIPRVVNLLCDRALIIAYGKNDTVIGKKIIHQAAIEALGEQEVNDNFWQQAPFKFAFVSILISLGIFAGYHFGFENKIPVNSHAENPVGTTKPNVIEDEKPSLTQPIEGEKQSDLTKANPDVSNKNLINKALMIKDKEEDQKPRVLGYQPEKVISALENKSLDDDTIEIVAEPGVSEDLLTRFKEAVNETKLNNSDLSNTDDIDNDKSSEEVQTYMAIHQMPVEIQNTIPTLQFEMHIYATEGQGWVRVNGEDRREGEQIANGVVLTQILPQKVLLTYQQKQFTMPALSSW